MSVEKPLYAKLNTAADWVIRVVLINILVIIVALPVVTWYLALSAGYQLFADYVNKDEPGVFKGFWHHLTHHAVRKLLLGVLSTVILLLCLYNILYYNRLLEEGAGSFYLMGYYLTMALMLLVAVVALHSMAVLRVYPDVKWSLFIKLSLVVAGKHMPVSLLLIPLYALPYVMMLLPVTAVIAVFAGISVPLLLHVLITRKSVLYLENLGGRDDQTRD
ncbi:MAG: DUF624 domain-containing protein [Acholeplasmataceae bacterium]|nr:MAG: DUF624 domain-containing protein [Acholeplasmataceae bacterium]